MDISFEPLLKQNLSRHVLFPIEYDKLFKQYKNATATFWRPEEIDLTRDKNDWEKLSYNEKRFIKYVLAFLRLVME